MLCEICKQEQAVVAIHMKLDGQELTVHACKRCSFAVLELGAQTLGLKPELFSDDLEKAPETTCPECGSFLVGPKGEVPDELGCPACYKHLPAEVRAKLLERQGRKFVSTLARTPADKAPKGRLSQLLLELQLAITQEEYERADELLARIKQVGVSPGKESK